MDHPVRSLVLAISCVARLASASPDDVGWATANINLGASSELSGAIAERLVREPCESSCPLAARIAIGGGIGRLGVDVQIASTPVEDIGATDARDRARDALRAGPVVRYSLVRRYGFDVALRTGLQYGRVYGAESTTSCPAGDETCMPVTYQPPAYSLWAAGVGATVQLGVRADGGYFALVADYEAALVRIGFPDDARSGVMRTLTFGFMFGSMFDLR